MRRLFPMEEAFTVSNEHDPLGVVCVLQVLNGPTPERLEKALQQLQERHPVLQAEIVRRNGRYYFRHAGSVCDRIGVHVISRTSPEMWRSVATRMLNTPFRKQCPMMSCQFVYDPNHEENEILLGFHHAGVDGAIIRLLLHEILCLCGDVPLDDPIRNDPDQPVSYPPWVKRLPRLVFREIIETFRYSRSGISSPVPDSSKNDLICLALSVEMTRKLKVIAGRKGLTLHTLILAAMTLALMKVRHSKQRSGLVKLVSFVNLRPHFVPEIPEWAMGCFISMLRLTVPYSRDMTIWEAAKGIRIALHQAGRKRDAWVMAGISKWLIRSVLKFKGPRLGLTALSFLGKLELDQTYGDMSLQHVRAFITNNKYGVEFSGFGKTLFGGLSLDCTYLTSEMREDQAEAVVKETRKLLEMTANSTNL